MNQGKGEEKVLKPKEGALRPSLQPSSPHDPAHLTSLLQEVTKPTLFSLPILSRLSIRITTPDTHIHFLKRAECQITLFSITIVSP